jgi:hypothetical protein
MANRIYTSFPVVIFSRPLATPPVDWAEVAQGPGYIDLPEDHEYGFRIHNIDNQELKALIAELAGIERLTYANLSENRKITEEGVELLRALPKLTYLNLSSCTLNNEAMGHLKFLIHLETLDISFCNRMTGPALKLLQPLMNLKNLNLQGCVKITNGDIARFKKRGLTIKK